QTPAVPVEPRPLIVVKAFETERPVLFRFDDLVKIRATFAAFVGPSDLDRPFDQLIKLGTAVLGRGVELGTDLAEKLRLTLDPHDHLTAFPCFESPLIFERAL